jgi:UDP-N-acetylmuramyl pentapeptide phosphotransferase/UDP-N-acetylglucosamine-1-phosphate transferase
MKKELKASALVGRYAFLLGVLLSVVWAIIAIINPLVATNTVVLSILVMLGILVGLLNISARETMPFLLASAVLVIMFGFGSTYLGIVGQNSTFDFIGKFLQGLLTYLMILVVPAGIVVALKELYAFAERV